MEALRLIGPMGLAVVAAIAVDQLTRARGLDPPGFVEPVRRGMAMAVVAGVLYFGVFLSLAQVGMPAEVDFEAVTTPELFLLHSMFVAALGAWFLLGYGGGFSRGRRLPGLFASQLGVRAANPLVEVGIGLGLGLLIWPLLLLTVGIVAVILLTMGGEELLPSEPPEMIVWIAGLPVVVKLAIAASAGIVEEAFFRGFLQPRVGIVLSTALFALAHLAYDQPFMLVGITLLSLFFAGLVVWRQNIWAAVTAHFLFDVVQLLVVIPWALNQFEQTGGSGLAPIAGLF